MSGRLRAKGDAISRAASPTTSAARHGEATFDPSRVKFFRHDDIDEGDEDDDETMDTSYRRRASERVVRTQRAPPQRPIEKTGVALSPTPGKGSGIAELCQYIQKLETEKRDLVDQVQFLRDQDATHKVNLSAASRRIDKLETLLQHASRTSDSQQQVQVQIEAAIVAEKEKTASMAARVESLQRRYEDSERARQHAVFKLSELQNTMAEAATNKLLTPPHLRPREAHPPTAIDPTSGSSERLEKYKREIELLRQKLELRDHQAQEKQTLAVSLALRTAHLDHAAALEKLKLECAIQLSEWRHDEAVRAKEIEAAMEQDRYSIRLEMCHGMQRAQIEQRVYYLQAQAALTSSSASVSAADSGDSGNSVPFSAMDEVLVRLQLELLRTRRFAALKTMLLIRQGVVDRAVRSALIKWRTLATQITQRRRHAVLSMHRMLTQFDKQDVGASFQRWRLHAQELTAESERQRVAACWNRMVAVERMAHVLQQRTVKRLAGAFHRWRLQRGVEHNTGSIAVEASPPRGDISPKPIATAVTLAAEAPATAEATTGVGGVELQDEIRKLHEQLASSKSEAWRYKRQLLKQFL